MGCAVRGVVDDRVEIDERVVTGRIAVTGHRGLRRVLAVERRVPAGRGLARGDVPHVLHVALPGEPRRRELVPAVGTEIGNTQPVPTSWPGGTTTPVLAKSEKIGQSPWFWGFGAWPLTMAT